MDHFDDWLRRLNPPRRNHFFTGKMMGVAQFEREQRYGMGQRWLLNRLTLGTGILCGLDVTVTSDGKQVRVEPGVAVDPLGREIVVARAVTGYDPFKTGGDCGCGEGPAIAEAGDYLLCLTYRECMADDQPAVYAEDCSGHLDCQPDTTVETFALGVRPVPEAPDGFDCDAWTAITDTAGASSSARTPLGIAALRQRLLQQFGASCRQIPEDACVPLGRITVAKNTDGTWAPLTASDAPRVQIYSQAQLLDIILCLASQVARCCDKKTLSTLRVTEIKAVKRGTTADTFTDIAETQPPNEGWPIYEPEAEVGAVVAAVVVPQVNFFLQVTFNGPVAPASLPLFTGNMTTPSVSLELTRTRAGITETIDIPLAGLLLPAPANNDKLILFTRPSNIRTNVPPKLGEVGIYQLTLRGSENPPLVVSIRSSETNEMLDGDENTDPLLPAGRRFPSGNGTHGGDFIFKFEVRDPD